MIIQSNAGLSLDQSNDVTISRHGKMFEGNKASLDNYVSMQV